MKKTFEEWMVEVDKACIKACGLSIYDLNDCNFADWYEDRVSAANAAKWAIKYAKEG